MNLDSLMLVLLTGLLMQVADSNGVPLDQMVIDSVHVDVTVEFDGVRQTEANDNGTFQTSVVNERQGFPLLSANRVSVPTVHVDADGTDWGIALPLTEVVGRISNAEIPLFDGWSVFTASYETQVTPRDGEIRWTVGRWIL